MRVKVGGGVCVFRERERVYRERERERERDGKYVQREGRSVLSNRGRGSVCSDKERVCGEIERGSVRGERKRGKDRVCAE